MPAILGIDAAWGPKAPSGVALVASSPRQGARGGWRCIALAPSIGAFLDLAEGRRIDWRRGGFQGEAVEARRLLEAARALGAGEVVCAGVDMPLAHGPITGRRPCDNAIARAYVGVHSPRPDRPGAFGRALQAGFEAEGFALATADPELGAKSLESGEAATTGRSLSPHLPSPSPIPPVAGQAGEGGNAPKSRVAPRRRGRGEVARAGLDHWLSTEASYHLPAARGSPAGRALLEVYPHAALMALLGLSRRFPYKVARSAQYWPGLPLEARAARLLGQFRAIRAALARELGPIALPLPRGGRAHRLSALKRYEDALDALVCAWVGILYWEGRARAFGDADAAIWAPEGERARPSRRPIA